MNKFSLILKLLYNFNKVNDICLTNGKLSLSKDMIFKLRIII